MREIKAETITKAVREMVIEANYELPLDVEQALVKARADEPWLLAQDTLGRIISNAELARSESLPMCQDTGMAVVFLEIGQEVHVRGLS